MSSNLREISVGLLECEIGPGMFPDEFAVDFTNADGGPVSGFFQDDLIQDGKLKVQVLSEKEDRVTIRAMVSSAGFFQCNTQVVHKSDLTLLPEGV